MRKGLESVEVVGLGQVCVDYVGLVPTYPAEDSKIELRRLVLPVVGVRRPLRW